MLLAGTTKGRLRGRVRSGVDQPGHVVRPGDLGGLLAIGARQDAGQTLSELLRAASGFARNRLVILVG